jgi:hypothetical protein
MVPSAEEILAGQRAYHRMRTSERKQFNASTWVFFILLACIGVFLGIRDGSPMAGIGSALIWLALLGIAAWDQRRRKLMRERDQEFLDQFRAKYGPYIYREIQKEPSSLYYYLFQKRYFPNQRHGSDLLP